MKTATDNPQLFELSRLIPKKLIKDPPRGKFGKYVPHFVIVQILLATTGPFDWEIVDKLYGDMPEIKTDDRVYPGGPGLVGVVMRLTLTIDGQRVVVEEVGACGTPAREPTDADRLKKSMSDAMKRAAMRLGVGIHLWCKDQNQVLLNRSMKMADDNAHEEDANEPAVLAEEEADTDE